MGTVMWDYIGTTIESIPPFPPKNQTDKETEDRRPGQLTPSSAERGGGGLPRPSGLPQAALGRGKRSSLYGLVLVLLVLFLFNICS